MSCQITVCVLAFAHPVQIRSGFPVAVITDDCKLLWLKATEMYSLSVQETRV